MHLRTQAEMGMQAVCTTLLQVTATLLSLLLERNWLYVVNVTTESTLLPLQLLDSGLTGCPQ